MEGLTFDDGVVELKTKFWPTYKVRTCNTYAIVGHVTSGDLHVGGIVGLALSPSD